MKRSCQVSSRKKIYSESGNEKTFFSWSLAFFMSTSFISVCPFSILTRFNCRYSSPFWKSFRFFLFDVLSKGSSLKIEFLLNKIFNPFRYESPLLNFGQKSDTKIDQKTSIRRRSRFFGMFLDANFNQNFRVEPRNEKD